MLNAVYLYFIERWLFKHHIPLLPRLFELLIFLVYNSKIPYQSKIGKGTKFGYGGIGVVLHKDCIIGCNCMVSQHVTIGGGNSRYPGIPIIGDNVHIAPGACVLGGITVGNNVVIGANAVVNKPIPDNAIVAGVPAKVLRIKEKN